MAHFAEIDEDLNVLRVIVVNNSDIGDLHFPESEPAGIAFCKSLFGNETNWLQTSYSGSFRKNYAGGGYRYGQTIDAFIPPKPFPSWLLNEENAQWVPPVPYPNDGQMHAWDEQSLQWVVFRE
jgi:hypothetical protein